MTGLDVLLLVLIGVLVYLGYRRGVIGETFDIVTAIVTPIVGLMVYEPLGALLNKSTEWGEATCQWIAAILIATPVAVALLILGMHLDRISRDDKKIPDNAMAVGGLLVSIPKSIFVLWLALILIKASPFYSQTTREEFEYAPVINFIEASGGSAGKAIFFVVAPPKAKKKIGPWLNAGF